MRAATIAGAGVSAIATAINGTAAIDRTTTIDPAAGIVSTTGLIAGIAITGISSAAVCQPTSVDAAPIHGCAPVAAAISASIATAVSATINHLLNQIGILPIAA
jgi:hypothetical protein